MTAPGDAPDPSAGPVDGPPPTPPSDERAARDAHRHRSTAGPDAAASGAGGRWTAILLALLALAVGVVIGLVTSPTVPDWIAPYLPIAVVAALDALFGALRAFLQKVFDARVFVVSFIGNVLVAALIVFLGDQLGVGSQLSTAVVVVLGIRIFANVAAIRRQVFHA